MKILRIREGHGDFSSAPIAPAKLLSGNPMTRTDHHYSNAANNFHCGIWASDSGKWALNYTEDEFCYIISGRAVITDADGVEEILETGDAFVVPAGFTGQWETLGEVRKFYAIYEKAD